MAVQWIFILVYMNMKDKCMHKITIEFDTEKKTINKIEGTEDINPIDIAKILMSVSLSALNKINIEPEKKIEIVKPKIIQGG
jgi:hypothetical protein